MSFLKKLFGKTTDTKTENGLESKNERLAQPYESQLLKKEMSNEVILYECIKVTEEKLISKNYTIVDLQEDVSKMPQITVEKDGIKMLVFVGACRNNEEIDVVFQREQLSDFMKFATENKADCLVSLVNITNPERSEKLYFGDQNSYTVKFKLYPSLL